MSLLKTHAVDTELIQQVFRQVKSLMFITCPWLQREVGYCVWADADVCVPVGPSAKMVLITLIKDQNVLQCLAIAPLHF